MKIRILMLSLMGVIFFNSCSSDSNSSDSNSNNSTSQNLDPNTILPKKIIGEGINGDNFFEFFYNQNKINYIQLGEEFGVNTLKCYFTYTGNLITKIQFGESGQELGFIDFTYQNNKLVNRKSTLFASSNGGPVETFISEVEYVYNSNNTISVSSNGILKTTYTLSSDQSYIDRKDGGFINYSSTSSPFKNVLGIKEAFLDLGYNFSSDFELIFFNTLFSSTTRNIISITPFPGGLIFADVHFSYAYNELLFPNTIIRFYGSVYGVPKYERTYNIFYQ
jgi:hypothetical protein